MKTIYSILSLACMIACSSSFAQKSKNISLEVSKDVFVRSGDFSHENHNHPTDILVKGGTVNPNFVRVGLFQFPIVSKNLGDIGKIKKATLHIYANYFESDVVSNPITVHSAASKDWNEKEVNFSTMPVFEESPLDSVIVFKQEIPKYVGFDITDRFKKALENKEGYLNLVIRNPLTTNFYFFSREFNYGKNKSYIELELE